MINFIFVVVVALPFKAKLEDEYQELIAKVYLPIQKGKVMFPLFETIAIENGKIKNIALHQARL